VADQVIARDPTFGVTRPRARRREAAMKLPTAKQVAAIHEAADDPFRAFVALAAFAGLRLGEVAALQVGDVDFLRGVVTVSRQVQRAGRGAVELRAPKYGSEREVYIPRALAEQLSAHVAGHRPGDDPSRWMLKGLNGNPPHQNTVGYYWRKACTAAGVEGVTLHDLRHFYASGLIASGCDVVTVQRALGHSKATTTLNTYAHLWPTAEDRTRTAAAALMVEADRAADSLRTEAAGTGS
jgi:integrase